MAKNCFKKIRTSKEEKIFKKNHFFCNKKSFFFYQKPNCLPKKMQSFQFSNIRNTRFYQSSPVQLVAESWGVPERDGGEGRTVEILMSNIGNLCHTKDPAKKTHPKIMKYNFEYNLSQNNKKGLNPDFHT